MLMHDPPHPGAFIRRQCLEPLGLTVPDGRLSAAFGSSPESWLQQQQYDLRPPPPDASADRCFDRIRHAMQRAT